ncbi:hypothetical protein DM01DRAFT_1223172 [Hesseltinella vesiculosa]|uniref:K Homology domain-containing protein n=1 Tax=Hesseltinella vesiculosa TaxID=101127 RepID=A0A1X2GPG3_9FUNG|nr:hypothetical protein DM01DRAFT_1223172 [Hesseltinella vesiculosa]
MSTSAASMKALAMQGMSLVKVQSRTYRIPTASMTTKTVPQPPKPSTDDANDTIYTDEIVTHYHPVQRTYHGFLIGKGGSTLKRMKLETGTRIDITDGEDLVMIKGTQDKVDNAIQVIDAFLQQAKDKARLTHFVSLPTMSSHTTRKLDDFHKELASYKTDGITPDLLIPANKLHMTLGVCKLLSQPDLEKAIQVIKQELPAIIQPLVADEQTVCVRLKKLAIMEKQPSKARILYIEAQDETKNKILPKLCDAIRDKLMENGIILDENRPLKACLQIHITLIKARTCKAEEGRSTFDARKILKSHGDLDLGMVHLDKLHLMKMGPLHPDGTYISDGSIGL